MSNLMSHVFDPKKHSIYEPKNKEKFMGSTFPICRSSWERAFCEYCDTNPSITRWSSETIEIQYYDPIKRKHRRYYPDFLVELIDISGKKQVYVIEIKPYKEIIKPVKSPGKKKKTKMYENATYITNQAKWRAANEWAKKRSMIFRIITEKELFKKR